MRTNTTKAKILELLERHHLLSLQEIESELGDAHFATVYRNAEQLCDDGELKRIVLGKDDVKYELAHHEHAYHFVCDSCGNVRAIENTPDFGAHVAHVSEVLVRGLCNSCSSK